MKIERVASLLVVAIASMFCTCAAIFLRKDGDDDKLFPRPLSIFSRPYPHADKNTSPGLIPHLGSVLHGGSIGIEIRPLGLVQGILGHAKKVIPGSKDTVGHPSYEQPPEKDPWDERRDWELEKPKKEANKEWEPAEKPGIYEPEEHKPEEEKPGMYEPEEDKPGKYKPDKPVRPSWDDIGESPEEYSTDVPIEDIIQPRFRPKRFIESKIYHVPLLYRSNGRPYQVKIKSRNDLDESKSESND